jgi:hypothetical protein
VVAVGAIALGVVVHAPYNSCKGKAPNSRKAKHSNGDTKEWIVTAQWTEIRSAELSDTAESQSLKQ